MATKTDRKNIKDMTIQEQNAHLARLIEGGSWQDYDIEKIEKNKEDKNDWRWVVTYNP